MHTLLDMNCHGPVNLFKLIQIYRLCEWILDLFLLSLTDVIALTLTVMLHRELTDVGIRRPSVVSVCFTPTGITVTVFDDITHPACYFLNTAGH